MKIHNVTEVLDVTLPTFSQYYEDEIAIIP